MRRLATLSPPKLVVFRGLRIDFNMTESIKLLLGNSLFHIFSMFVHLYENLVPKPARVPRGCQESQRAASHMYQWLPRQNSHMKRRC
jgi:hypothetical protein